jgi:GT2 family glycosyltransferase
MLFLAVSYGSPDEAHSFGRQFRYTQIEHRAALLDNTQGEAHGQLQREFEAPSDNVRCFTAPDNLGYFGGLRYALELDWVREYAADWIVVSNVDVLFDPDAVAGALRHLGPADVACVAPSIVSQLSGVDLNPYMRSRPPVLRMHFYKHLFRWYLGLAFYMRVSELVRGKGGLQAAAKRRPAAGHLRIYAPHGSFMILGRGYFERGGSLAHAPFLFGEEITIAERARQMNLPVIYLPEIRIEHAEHVSTSRIPSRQYHRFMRESVRFIADSYFS